MRKQRLPWLGVIMAAVLVLVLGMAGCSGLQAAPGAAANAAVGSAPGGGSQEGIKVHGHWTIEVTNPDGTLAERREFENALTGSGSANLADIMSRQKSVGGWLIHAGAAVAADSPFMQPPSSGLDCWIVESAYVASQPWVFRNLTVSAPSSGTNAHKVVLSGTATAQRDGKIDNVTTGIWTLDPALPPASSYPGGGLDFTAATLTAVNVSAGQQIAVTVVISFS